MAYFRELPKLVDGKRLIEVAFNFPLSHNHIQKFEKEYEAEEEGLNVNI